MIDYLSLKKITALHRQEIDDAISKVVNSGWYVQGEALKEFETAYAHYLGTKYCVGCANGSDAIWLILRAYIELGLLSEGDEVLVPANTYIGSILPITQNRLIPKLIEPKIKTLQIDDRLLEISITERTKAIILVHLYGHCAYTEKIAILCKQYNLLLIEDNAQAHGCMFNDKYTGSLGNVAAHSFYPGKNLGALGDGGAITTNDSELANMVRILGNYGSEEKYKFVVKGRNSRLDELQAAILSVKLKFLHQENIYRRSLASIYLDNIYNPLINMPLSDCKEEDVYHIFPILCLHRDTLQKYLKNNGIETIIHYPIPPHKQKAYVEWNNLLLPITEEIHAKELSLPLNPALEKDEVYKIVDIINNFRIS